MFIVLIISKLIARILNILGRGGTTLPGKVALYFKYDILTKLSKNVHIICVTGTNGKTTTCALIEQGMKNANKSYFINKSGANMITGVTTAFINNCTVFGKPKCDYAILECDENSLPEISRYIDADIVVVTNIFRDQLDRYGEVSTTLKKIKEGIDNFESAILVLNADCPLTYSLSKLCSNKTVSFGMNYCSTSNIVTDSPYCPICNNLLRYNSKIYSQLGDFYCNSCGYKRSMPDVLATDYCEDSFCVDDKNISLSLGGIYNAYNYLSAVSVLKLIGLSVDSLSGFNGAFGRMEHFNYNGINILLMLVKNPVGFSNCLEYTAGMQGKYNLIFSLNDKDADGKDVSWIWDVDFNIIKPKIYDVFTLGTRSYDMSLRLKYDDISSNALSGECYNRLIDIIKSFNRDVIIFSTYTSMMTMRHYLINEFGGDEFWL
ncbi:MAG: MurT ligase domain-containing protein [Eubacterium sp.]